MAFETAHARHRQADVGGKNAYHTWGGENDQKRGREVSCGFAKKCPKRDARGEVPAGPRGGPVGKRG